MVKSYLRRLAEVQEKYPLLVVLFVVTVSLFFLYYGIRIETDSNFDVMQREDSESLRLQRMIDMEFGGTDSIFVFAKIDQDVNDKERVQDIRDPGVFRALKDLTRSLESETYVVSAISMADLFEMVYGRLPSTLEESKWMIDNFPEELKEQYLGSVLSNDYQYTNMLISVSVENTPGSLQRIEDNVRQKISQTPFPIGVSADIAGLPMLYNTILNYLINDNMKTILYAIIGVILILWIYFKSWKIAIFSAIPTMLTLVWLAGTMTLLDIKITVMTASIGAMMIGMSVDYAIHLTHRFHENVREGHDEPVEDTVVGIGSALFASVTTTIAGFLAMLLGISPNSQVQGTVLSIGIAYAFVVSIVALPPLMLLQRKYLYSKLDQVLFKLAGRRESSKKNVIDKFLEMIAHFQVNHPSGVLIAVGIITLLIIPGFGLVYMDTDGKNWIPDNDPTMENFEVISNNFGGTDSMNLLLVLDQTTGGDFDKDAIRDLRDPRVLAPMAALDKIIEKLKWVDSVDSPTNSIRQFNGGRIPKELDEIKSVLDSNPSATSQFNDDYSLARITIRSDMIDRPEYYELLDELDGIRFPGEVSVIPQGAVPEDLEFEQTMGADTVKTTLVGFLLVIIIASLFYRSLMAGLLAFIPIIFSIVWTVGVMGYIDLPFTVLTTGMLAILMGMGIDFSIHLIHSVREKMEMYNGDVEKAMPHALMGTGQAISITTITTIVGFMALSFATLVNTMRLGWTLAVGIAMTFFACIIIVPAVLSLKYQREARKKADEGK